MIAPHIKETIYSKGASVIRKMFEEGIQLKAKYGAENVYDFTLGNPDLDPPDEVVKAVKEVAEDTSHGRHGYMPNAGYMETRQAMAEKTAEEQGVAVSGKNILMTVGAASALNCVFKAILTPGDIVIVPRPFFAEYRHYVRNFQGLPTWSRFPRFWRKTETKLRLSLSILPTIPVEKCIQNQTSSD